MSVHYSPPIAPADTTTETAVTVTEVIGTEVIGTEVTVTVVTVIDMTGATATAMMIIDHLPGLGLYLR